MKTTNKLLKKIKKITTLIAVASIIATMGMPIYAEDTGLEINQNTPVQDELIEKEVADEVVEGANVEEVVEPIILTEDTEIVINEENETILDETFQDNLTEEEIINTEVIEPILDETQLQSTDQNDVASFSLNNSNSNTVVVSFELDNAADGQYIGGKTSIELNKGSKINLNEVPDFESSNLKEHKGWTLNGQPLNNNPYMYLMMNQTINSNLVFKPVFGEATKYTIQLGVETLNTGYLTGNTSFLYSSDIAFDTVFTSKEFNQVEAVNGYYFKGWKLNGILYTTYEALSAEASKIQNQNINLIASFGTVEFTLEFFVDENSKDYVSFKNGSQYLQFISEESITTGLSIIGGNIPELIIAEGYEVDTWVFGQKNVQYFTESELYDYLSADDFSCNQYFTIKVKKTDNFVTPTPTPTPTPTVTPTPTPTPTPTVNPTPTPDPEVTPIVDPEVPVEVEEVIVPVVNVPVNEEVIDEEITEEETPLVNEDAEVALETIDEEETPLAVNKGSWALVNLVMTVLTFIIAVVLLIKKKKQDEEENTEVIYKKKFKIAALLVSIISIILFILTEDMRLPMVLVDKYTIVMVCLTVVQIVVSAFSKKTIDSTEDETLVHTN